MLEAQHIVKSFGAKRAVSDVSFRIERGEVAVLLGPNGAGKTTTMRVLVGYFAPDSGEVLVDGISATSDPIGVRRLIGYLPESNPLYRDLLVADYLTFSAALMELPSRERRAAFDRVVPEAGISDVFYTPIGELSKGYRQRVGLASALIADPPVLVLDEPTEGLDPNQRTDMRTLLTELAHDKTVLVSTHVLSEAQQLASKVIVLASGAIAGMGTIEELLGASAGKRFTIELEGHKPDAAVAGLPSVAAVEVVQSKGKRMRLSVAASDPDKLPRELSQLIGTEKLVVWRMEPEHEGLERVFASLTRDTHAFDPQSTTH